MRKQLGQTQAERLKGTNVSEMMQRLFRNLPLMLEACVVLMLSPCLAHAETFQCEGASGVVTTQQTPCPSANAPKSVQSLELARKPGEVRRGNPRDEAAITYMLAIKALCDLNVPNFKSKNERLYARWRQKQQLIVQDIEDMPELRDALTEQVQQWARERKDWPLQRQNAECDYLMETMEATAGEELPRQPLSSPEKTWQTFVDAFIKGHRDLALSCLTMSARDFFKNDLLTKSHDDLKKLGASLRSIMFAPPITSGETATMSETNGIGEIRFVRKGTEWLISGIGKE